MENIFIKIFITNLILGFSSEFVSNIFAFFNFIGRVILHAIIQTFLCFLSLYISTTFFNNSELVNHIVFISFLKYYKSVPVYLTTYLKNLKKYK